MKRKGFTLIELLVVIAIIAILAAIFFPVFARARTKARQTKCGERVKRLSRAFSMYQRDWDGYTPPASKDVRVATLLFPYIADEGDFGCAEPTDELGKGPVSYLWNDYLLRGGETSGVAGQDTILLFGEGIVEDDDRFTMWEDLSWPHQEYGYLTYLDGHIKVKRGVSNEIPLNQPDNIRIRVSLPVPTRSEETRMSLESGQVVSTGGKAYRLLTIEGEPELVPLE
jgi:prepilin-type N-terminal cleavage/methylation domain-containing protein